MYHQYFGLKEAPFSISVNPRYLFMSPRHRDALAHLLYGVGSGGGFILLTGEVGTGKTTINRCLLEQLPKTTDLAIVLNPALSAVELLATVCDELDIHYPAETQSLKNLTDALHSFLLANHAAGRKTVMMIDEAQHLDFDVLEQIRLLTNLETDEEKLLQIILIGQPELTEKLARPELRQLNQRITARYDLQPLSADETTAYIRHRLEVAGLPGGRELFPRGVVREIHRASRGIPRQINLLCDRALLGAYGRKQQKVNRGLVRSAAAEVFGQSEQRQSRSRLAMAAGLVAVLVLGLLVVFRTSWMPAGDAPISPVEIPSESTPQVVAPPEATTRSDSGSWLLTETRGEQWLWQMSSDAPEPPVPCPADTIAGLRCVQAEAEVWEPVIALERPVLLATQTPDRFSATTLVLAFENRTAWVATPSGAELVPLAELAKAWRGGYRFYWSPPAGWMRPLALGDTTPAVARVAQLFAELDGQAESLTEGVFNDALATRVKLFQAAEGLQADGVIGAQTLLRLNARLGRGVAQRDPLARASLLLGAD